MKKDTPKTGSSNEDGQTSGEQDDGAKRQKMEDDTKTSTQTPTTTDSIVLRRRKLSALAASYHAAVDMVDEDNRNHRSRDSVKNKDSKTVGIQKGSHISDSKASQMMENTKQTTSSTADSNQNLRIRSPGSEKDISKSLQTDNDENINNRDINGK